MNLQSIKSALRHSWPVGIILALILVLGIALFSGSAQAHVGHGWGGGGYYHGGGYGEHYAGRPYVRIAVGGGWRYAPYYPYYVGVYDASWVVEYVQSYDPSCNCYVTIRVYVDRFGNTYPAP